VPPLIEIEATINPPPPVGLVTITLKPTDLQTLGGHEHTNLIAAELNHAVFVDDNGSRLQPAAQCTTDPTTGACHVFLLALGPGCGDPLQQIGTSNRVSNGWCEVAGDYLVTATSAAATAGSTTLRVGKDPGGFLPPQAPPGAHYITAINPTGHSRFTYGTPNMVADVATNIGVKCLAEKFWQSSRGFVLSFNDISLPNGGLFDSGGPGSAGGNWHPPHLYHRLGTGVDINNSTTNPNLGGPPEHFKDQVGNPLPLYAKLSDAADRCGLYPVDEGPIHFELKAIFR
jgi:hypothetical protein